MDKQNRYRQGSVAQEDAGRERPLILGTSDSKPGERIITRTLIGQMAGRNRGQGHPGANLIVC